MTSRHVTHTLALKKLLSSVEGDVAEIVHLAHTLLQAKKARHCLSNQKEEEMLQGILSAAKRISN